ncbi:MAG: bifunctional DNA-binding transcriptional regulator/O6-methylguanine-DNA methyltransferase Ada [Gemmatimonas sp.]|nr:bifunctional DNA-binding transcriptional regulator/O6-methylguanine-DNA methyltransferase Ada [Gemmatimonas sp.]
MNGRLADDADLRSASHGADAIDPETAWTAVLSRDPLFDGVFFYAVRTTAIYCRPICPSRRPLRENVAFFRSSHGAEAAGFRPCRRCRPDGIARTAAATAVEGARSYLDENSDRTVTLDELSRVVHMSPFHLQRMFKRLTGLSPLQYLHRRRSEKLRESLRAGAPVGRAMNDAGYGSNSRLYDQADAHLGMTPSTYGKGGRGMRIEYALSQCRLGLVLVAATERGVCAISLGEDAHELIADLEGEYPNAQIAPAEKGLGSAVRAVLEYLDGSQTGLDLPLDVQPTVFQMRVWRALRSIPYAATASYGEVAVMIGAPTAARAVARACATNPVALAIPCHRVGREDGQPSGYRWGPQRKQRLLEMEVAQRRKA